MAYKDPNDPRKKDSRNKWYARNKDSQIRRQAERRKEHRAWLTQYKRTLYCSDCGMGFYDRPECCDFHHHDPDKKDIGISHAVNGRWSKNRVLIEINKCVPICANCHRTRHLGKEE